MAKSKLGAEPLSQPSIREQSPARNRQASIVDEAIRKSIETKQLLSEKCLDQIVEMAHILTTALRDGRSVVFFGNGGSAADAQHISAELVGKFKKMRPAFRSLALTTNTSVLTAIGNDFGFEEVFARQVEANMGRGDVAVAISTSGRSPNVIKAVKEARRIGAKTIALTGSGGGLLASLCDHSVTVPSDDTQRIQECHIMIGHAVCELIEDSLTGKEN